MKLVFVVRMPGCLFALHQYPLVESRDKQLTGLCSMSL